MSSICNRRRLCRFLRPASHSLSLYSSDIRHHHTHRRRVARRRSTQPLGARAHHGRERMLSVVQMLFPADLIKVILYTY